MGIPNLFEDKNKVKMGFWDYKNLPVGSRLVGTLVCKRTVPNNFKQGEDQLVYDIKTENGDIITVFGKPLIDNRMKAIRLGQYVAFEYKGEAPSKKPGMKPAKLVEVFADPNLVDEKWLKDQEEEATVQEIAAEFNQPEVPSFNEPATGNKDTIILDLAIKKIPGTTAENYKTAVMTFTKLAYIDGNLDEIIKVLSA